MHGRMYLHDGKFTGRFPWGTPRAPKNGSDSYVNGLREEAIWKKYKYEDRRSEVKVREKIRGQVQGLVGLPSPET